MVTVTAIQYNEIETQTQKILTEILQDDTTISTVTDYILDGKATTLSKTAFPRIIVHTPTVEETRLTMTKFKVVITCEILIIDKKEGNVRTLAGHVRNALRTNQSSTRDAYLWWLGFDGYSTDLALDFLPDEKSTPVWTYTLRPTYRWIG